MKRGRIPPTPAPRPLFAPGEQFPRTRGVNRNRVVEVPLRGAHANRHREALQHFVCAGPDDVAAHDALLRTHANQFHIGMRLSRRQGVVHRREIGHVYLHGVPILSARFGFARAHGPDGRMREHHGRNHAVFEMAVGLAAEQAVAQAPAGGNGDGSEGGTAGHVADGVYARNVRILEAVGDHVIAVVHRDAGLAQIEFSHIRGTSNSPLHTIEAWELPAVFRDQGFEARDLANRGWNHVGVDGYASLAHFAHQGLAEHGVEAHQQVILADEQFHCAAEFVERPGELARDVAAADYGHPLGPLLELEKAVGCDAMFRSRQVRQDGLAAGRNHDVPRRHALTIHFDAAPVQKSGGAAHVGDPFGRQIALVNAVQPQNVGIAFAFQCRPIVALHGNIETIVGGIDQPQGHARGVPHDLLRYAADVHAGPSQAVRFDHGDLGAIFGRALCAGQPAAAAAHADEIEGLIRHCELHAETQVNPDDILRRFITRGMRCHGDRSGRDTGPGGRIGRVPDRHLQRTRRSARKRQDRMGKYRRAVEAAPRRAAETGGNLQTLHAVRAGNPRESDARPGLRQPGQHLGQCCRGRRGRAAAARGRGPAVRRGRKLSPTEERRNLQAIAGQDNRAGRIHRRPPGALQRPGQSEQYPGEGVPGRRDRAKIRLSARAAAGIHERGKARRRGWRSVRHLSRTGCQRFDPDMSGHGFKFWLIVAALAAAAAYSFWYAFKAWARNRVIEDTPTSRVRSAAQGYVEISGLSVLPPNCHTKAPLTRVPCAWWRYKIEERRYAGRSRSWFTIQGDTSTEPFLLDDGTGQCLIDPRGAEVFPGASNVWYGASEWPEVRIPDGTGILGRLADALLTDKYRYTEYRLQAHEHVYAIGAFRSLGGAGAEDTETAAANLLHDWKKDQG